MHSEMETFAKTVVLWQRRHGRHDLPWQKPRTPYRVWVSETMLQQTQVQTVIPYFKRFMEQFPDVFALAAANTDQVMALWAGLGYYSRARRLHEAARMVASEMDGFFPDDLDGLMQLPGVGRSTAGAILALGFDKRGVVLDGNVKRVLCRHFGVQGDPSKQATQKRLWRLAEELTPHENHAAFVQGMMDLGATLCRRSRPDCAACPLRKGCYARQNACQEKLPHRRERRTKPVLKMQLGWFQRADGAIAMVRRGSGGIWAGMYCLPEIEHQDSRPIVAAIEHELTHRRLILDVRQMVEADLETLESLSVCWYHAGQTTRWAFPAPIAKLLSQEMTHGSNSPLQKTR